jgi:hypothetical protein
MPIAHVCVSTYYYNGKAAKDGSCTLISNAFTITSTAITGCSAGYYLNSNTGRCVSCGTGIATCVSPSDSVKALTCKTHFYLT